MSLRGGSWIGTLTTGSRGQLKGTLLERTVSESFWRVPGVSRTHKDIGTGRQQKQQQDTGRLGWVSGGGTSLGSRKL